LAFLETTITGGSDFDAQSRRCEALAAFGCQVVRQWRPRLPWRPTWCWWNLSNDVSL